MPKIHQIDRESKLISVAVQGSVNQDMLIEHIKELVGDEAFTPDMNTLFDARDCHFYGNIDRLPNLAKKLGDASIVKYGIRIALLVSNTMQQDIARVFTYLVDNPLFNCAVFTCEDEANAWLSRSSD